MTELPNGVGFTSYKALWNEIAAVTDHAYRMVDEGQSEEQLVRHGEILASALSLGMRFDQTDTVLDLGCGVARIGREVAPLVGRWIGVDVSDHMLAIARERMKRIPNAEFVVADGSDMRLVADSTVTKGYCHAVFLHMDKEDFYSYLCEIRRVLRPHGLFYFDTWNIADPNGWLRWEYERAMYATKEARPLHRNQFSTPQEVSAFVRHAGLVEMHMAANHMVQTVVTRAVDGESPEATRRAVEEKYDGAFRHLVWLDSNIALFRSIMLRLLKEARDRGRPIPEWVVGSDPAP